MKVAFVADPAASLLGLVGRDKDYHCPHLRLERGVRDFYENALSRRGGDTVPAPPEELSGRGRTCTRESSPPSSWYAGEMTSSSRRVLTYHVPAAH